MSIAVCVLDFATKLHLPFIAKVSKLGQGSFGSRPKFMSMHRFARAGHLSTMQLRSSFKRQWTKMGSWIQILSLPVTSHQTFTCSTVLNVPHGTFQTKIFEKFHKSKREIFFFYKQFKTVDWELLTEKIIVMHQHFLGGFFRRVLHQ
jgi:hypothetical protein